MSEPNTLVERAEEDLSWAGLAVAGTIRVAELAVIAVAALIFVPPLAILAVVVIVPVVVLAAGVAVIALPVLLVRHFQRHRAEHSHHHRVRRLVALGRRSVVARPLTKLGAPR